MLKRIFSTLVLIFVLFFGWVFSVELFDQFNKDTPAKEAPKIVSGGSHSQPSRTINRLPSTMKTQEIAEEDASEIDNMASYSQIVDVINRLPPTANAQEIAGVLTLIGSLRLHAEDIPKVEQLTSELVLRLREIVKTEVNTLQNLALSSMSYREGYTLSREAGAILSVYPLADDPKVLDEAESLSSRQNEVVRRLELIRRQRYNHWAAGQVENALRILRENGKKGTEPAIGYLQIIEPSLLEPSVSSLYSYASTEMMDFFKHNEKAKVAKDLTNPSITRRGLEDF